MLKIRVIAIIIALALTALTIYLVPIITHHYISFVNSLNAQEKTWFSWVQAFIGFAIAAYGFWRWKKKSASKK